MSGPLCIWTMLSKGYSLSGVHPIFPGLLRVFPIFKFPDFPGIFRIQASTDPGEEWHLMTAAHIQALGHHMNADSHNNQSDAR